MAASLGRGKPLKYVINMQTGLVAEVGRSSIRECLRVQLGAPDQGGSVHNITRLDAIELAAALTQMAEAMIS